MVDPATQFVCFSQGLSPSANVSLAVGFAIFQEEDVFLQMPRDSLHGASRFAVNG